ncbi:probable ATP-dependent RNA helicase DDX4 isoform X2 [Daphnia carinata]|uniref:probable ATP-dependent RNA helicase DDX4 isoform X2 n=1 Tax=Daphnia carinata TaxID=120202 RepID=UPI0025795D39|nr:probable ATP-dependent RNA helicase DDX4 isoform X2 [Daphnia carinata]
MCISEFVVLKPWLCKGIICGERFRNFDKFILQVTVKDVPQYVTPFEGAGLRQLLQNIKNSGYIKPTPVQNSCQKRYNCLCCHGLRQNGGVLGTGFEHIVEQGVAGTSHAMGQKPEVVIVAPTRELAIQIHRDACKFSYNSVLKSVIIYGGAVTSHQWSNLQARCNTLVATVEYLTSRVSGFKFWTKLIERLIWVSAPVLKKLSTIQRKESIVFVCFRLHSQMKYKRWLRLTWKTTYSSKQALSVAPIRLLNSCFSSARKEIRAKLIEVLQDLGDSKTIVFVDSKKTGVFVAGVLCNNNLQSTSIHGDRLQSQREQALRDVKNDIVGVNYVVNDDEPTDIEEYVHRVGRMGRVGNVRKSIRS